MNNAFFEGEIILLPKSTTNKKMPGTKAVANETAFKIGSGRIECRKIRKMSVTMNLFGFKCDKIGVIGFGNIKEVEDSGRGNIIIRIDKPKIFSFGVFGAEITGGGGALCGASVGTDELGVFLAILLDDFGGIVGGVIIDEQNLKICEGKSLIQNRIKTA